MLLLAGSFFSSAFGVSAFLEGLSSDLKLGFNSIKDNKFLNGTTLGNMQFRSRAQVPIMQNIIHVYETANIYFS